MRVTLKASWHEIKLGGVSPDLFSRSSHNAVLLRGKAYLFGGELRPRIPVGDELLVIDLNQHLDKEPSTATFADVSVNENFMHASGRSQAWPVARVGATMTAHERSNTILLWGGRGGKEMQPIATRKSISDSCEAVEDIWTFNIATKEWSQIPTKATGPEAYPEARSFHTMTVSTDQSGDDFLYVHAGCPASGRLGSLHSLHLGSNLWNILPDGPEPGRGGTVMIPIKSRCQEDPNSLLRWGGFCGYELGGPLEIYDVVSRKWSSHHASKENEHGTAPPKRSVHGLVPYLGPAVFIDSDNQKKEFIAVMFMGEGSGAPKELGHDGAGQFLNDVYALLRSSTGQFSWLALDASGGDGAPEPRGWFAFDFQIANEGSGIEIFMHGGLNNSNERLGDAWILRISFSGK